MTRQEIFDTVWNWFKSRDFKRSIVVIEEANTITGALEKVACKYRAPDGNKCAIGCLMPDEVYQESIEGRAVSAFSAYSPDDRVPAKVLEWYQSLINASVGERFLTKLQNTHDCNIHQPLDVMLRTFAAEYYLTVPV